MSDASAVPVSVEFVAGIEAAQRAELTEQLREFGAVPNSGTEAIGRVPDRLLGELVRIGWDLAHGGAEMTASAAGAVRDWLRDHAAPGTGSQATLELLRGGEALYARVTGDDPDTAIGALHSALPDEEADGPIAWTGHAWEPAAAPPAVRRPPAGAHADPERPLRVLAVADEWFPQRGGISAFNRRLCAALAAVGHEAVCLLPAASPQEHRDAAELGVRLVEASALPGMTDRETLLRRPLLRSEPPDVVLGHSRVTGPSARLLVEDHYPGAALLHFVHTEPDQLEFLRPAGDADAAARAEHRGAVDLELSRAATRAVAVGPRLHAWLQRDLPQDAPRPAHRIDPGFDLADEGARTPPLGVPLVMIMGRMGDAHIKGLDLAAKAVGRAADSDGTSHWELCVRGVPADEGRQVRDQVLEWVANPRVDATPRNFTTDFAALGRDLRRASLVLMPSRAEAFGLVGMEAVIAGTPVLVSSRSGLGHLLREMLPPELADRLVVDVDRADERDVPRWARRVAEVMSGREEAFAVVDEARRILAAKCSWASAVDGLLAGIRPAAPGHGTRSNRSCQQSK